jgi:alpha-ketoglutarate-dependent taurine dioxygenase
MYLDSLEVSVRFPFDHERGIVTTEKETPLVIEAVNDSSKEFLFQFLEKNSKQVLTDISNFGAVLIRGFELDHESDFEKAIESIKGMVPILRDDVLFYDSGRLVIEGTKAVMHTNANYKTGGTLSMPCYHTENYYAPDVSQYISFYCKQPSELGGETGIVNMCKLYSLLPESIKEKMTSQSFLVGSEEVETWQLYTGMSEQELFKFCSESGLQIARHNERSYLLIFKPSVIRHPVTRELALNVNMNTWTNFGLAQSLKKKFLADYSGSEWWLHRIVWRMPWWISYLRFLTPQSALAWLRYKMTSKDQPNFGDRISSILNKQEIDVLASAIRQSHASVQWKAGDILIIDNLKMAHEGMPGRGDRVIRAIIANPVRFPLQSSAPGLAEVELTQDWFGLGRQLEQFKKRRSSPP